MGKVKNIEYDIDYICEKIVEGESLTSIAKHYDVTVNALIQWYSKEDSHSVRVREARITSAKISDEKAERSILNAKNWFELKQAAELAHHYRWRSSKTSPKEYGDKLDITSGNDKITAVQVEIVRKQEDSSINPDN